MGIDGIARPNQLSAPQNIAPQEANRAPAALQGARHSTGVIVARVIAGIMTAGISEGVIAMHRGVQSYRAEKARVAEALAAELAQAQIDTSNNSLASSLQSGRGLSAPMKQAVQEAMQDLAASFGDANVTAKTKDIKSWPSCNELCNYIRQSQTEINPTDLKNLLVEHGRAGVINQTAGTLFANLKAEDGLTDKVPSSLSSFLEPSLSGLHSGLKDCQSANDVQAIFAQYKTPLKEAIAFAAEVENVKDSVRQEGIDNITQVTGLSTQTVVKSSAMQAFNKKAQVLYTSLRAQTPPPHGDALKAAFSKILEDDMMPKARLMASSEILAISDTLKQDFRDSVFTNHSFKDPNLFINGSRAAQNIHTASLISVLQSPDAQTSDEELLGMFQAIGAQLNDNLAQEYGDAFKNLDGNERSNARNVTVQIFLDKNPHFVAALRDKPTSIERVAQYLRGLEQGGASSEREQTLEAYNTYVQHILGSVSSNYSTANTHLSDNIPRLWGCTIRQHDAMNTAIEDIRTQFGDGAIPAGNTLEEMNQSYEGKAIVRSLQTAISQADHAVSPQELHFMAYSTLQSTATSTLALNFIQELAQKAGTPLDRYSAENMLETLKSRHPDLNERFEAATNPAVIVDALKALPDLQAIRQYTFDIEREGLKERVFERLTQELATALATTPEDLKNDFNPNNSIGNHVVNIAIATNEATAKPDTPIPSAAQIIDKFTDKIHSVVHEKVALVNTLSSTHGVQNRPLSLDAQAELRHRVLQNTSVRQPEILQYFATIASRLNTDACIAALNTGDYDASLQALKELGGSIINVAIEVIPDETFRRMDPDAKASIGYFVQTILLDTSTELRSALNDNKELLKDVRALLDKEVTQIGRQIARAGDDMRKIELLQTQYGSVTQTVNILNEILEDKGAIL